ncbi:protein pygopus-like [Rhipicephalus sanguineus]|uniref:protein pygopus-like n=1 Tax=Rhipicephalus sanguineus TaxID=34632 RepID=UPI0020C3D63A|nr:protein pygopus-like [Rhipicephalus sanguineus]
MLDSVQPLQITGHSETIAASSSSDDADNSPQPGASPRPATLHQPPQSPQARMPPVKAPAMSPSSAVQPHKPKSSGNASGKVYSSSRRMVYDRGNPTAAPIYPCGVCHKAVEDYDEAILCDSGCNFWFHRACTDLTNDAFDMFTREAFTEWVCDRCASSRNVPLEVSCLSSSVVRDGN